MRRHCSSSWWTSGQPTRPALSRQPALFLLLVLSARGDFTPEVLATIDSSNNTGTTNLGKAYLDYRNDPLEYIPASKARFAKAMQLEAAAATDLLYEAPLSHLGSTNAVVGLASYPYFFSGFQRLVGSLRASNYSGHIILGVSDMISTAEFEYLKSMHVTLYTVTIADCDEAVFGTTATKKSGGKSVAGQLMRGKCTRGLEHLKVEMGRFELARQWLQACATCTGWSLVLDTRDTFFQSDPLLALGEASTATVNLLFVEEVAPHTSPLKDPSRSFVAGNPRNDAHTIGCYGRDKYDHYGERPVLCSGTVIGTRAGMHRFLSVMTDEFLWQNTQKSRKCRSPHTTDQWTMNFLYYNGRFGEEERTVTIPWGMGPVLTVGKACMDKNKKTGGTDMVPRDSQGFMLNRFEGRRAPVVHQFDRCGKWMSQWLLSKPDIFRRPGGVEEEKREELTGSE